MNLNAFSINSLLAVAVGGAAGSLLRYTFSILLRATSLTFPWATLTVNILGSFLIGFLYSNFSEPFARSENLRLLAITGFLGGFTTFSAFSNETFELLKADRLPTALAYIGLSIGLSLTAVFFGSKIRF